MPLVDITAAAGTFSDLQVHNDFEWVELPINIAAKEGYFVCKVIGESMNKVIPNDSWCLFQKDSGGSREGKVVLVEHYNIQDSDFGAGYTVKKYHSEKLKNENGWSHSKIILEPSSDDSNFDNIILEEDEVNGLKVVGIFITVLSI